MIKIDAVTQVSRVKLLTDELADIQPGQSFVYQAKDAKIINIVLDRLMIDGYSEPIDNDQYRFFVAGINLEHEKTDNKIKAMIPCSRRYIMRRLHLSASQIDDAVSRMGLVISSNNPIIYKLP